MNVSVTQQQRQHPAALPAPPRPVTSAARRRAWIDPRVRFWWIVAGVILAIGAYFFVSQYFGWREDARLIEAGTRIAAVVTQADQADVRGKTVAGDSAVHLQYDYDGRTYETEAPYLDGRRADQFLIVGQTVPIRIDPAHPDRWTYRESPAPLSHQLIGGFIALPAGIFLLWVSLVAHARTLKTWREGDAVQAVVVSARHTATVPRGWAVRCTPASGADKRVYDVFAPADADVSEGAAIWLLFPPSGGRPLAAEWFMRQ